MDLFLIFRDPLCRRLKSRAQNVETVGRTIVGNDCVPNFLQQIVVRFAQLLELTFVGHRLLRGGAHRSLRQNVERVLCILRLDAHLAQRIRVPVHRLCDKIRRGFQLALEEFCSDVGDETHIVERRFRITRQCDNTIECRSERIIVVHRRILKCVRCSGDAFLHRIVRCARTVDGVLERSPRLLCTHRFGNRSFTEVDDLLDQKSSRKIATDFRCD